MGAAEPTEKPPMRDAEELVAALDGILDLIGAEARVCRSYLRRPELRRGRFAGGPRTAELRAELRVELRDLVGAVTSARIIAIGLGLIEEEEG